MGEKKLKMSKDIKIQGEIKRNVEGMVGGNLNCNKCFDYF